jgi:uncharacterized membrane protein
MEYINLLKENTENDSLDILRKIVLLLTLSVFVMMIVSSGFDWKINQIKQKSKEFTSTTTELNTQLDDINLKVKNIDKEGFNEIKALLDFKKELIENNKLKTKNKNYKDLVLNIADASQGFKIKINEINYKNNKVTIMGLCGSEKDVVGMVDNFSKFDLFKDRKFNVFSMSREEKTPEYNFTIAETPADEKVEKK